MAPRGTAPGSARTNSTSTARSRRRSRLRTTALPSRRCKAKATRRVSQESSSRKVTARDPRRTRTPWARSAMNVRRSPMASIRPTAGSGPSHVGCARWHDRRGSTCACETHGSWPACGRSAERCASLVLLEGPADSPGWCVHRWWLRTSNGAAVPPGGERRTSSQARAPPTRQATGRRRLRRGTDPAQPHGGGATVASSLGAGPHKAVRAPRTPPPELSLPDPRAFFHSMWIQLWGFEAKDGSSGWPKTSTCG